MCMYGRDKTKKDHYMIRILMKMFSRGELHKDYILQRQSGQFDTETRDGLVASVLRSEDIDPIKLCEQLIGERIIIWLIDGLQRITTCDDFRNGKFKMGKNLMMPYTYYQKDGQVVGFDMRGKGWSDFPEELQDRFDDYSFDVVKHLDCTDEEIAYHMARCNRCAKMNANQKGILYMYKIAGYVKKLSQNHRFFFDCGNYTSTEKKKGVIDRVVNETIMLIYHLDDWKRGKAMNIYLNENANKEEFDEFENELDRLNKFIDQDTTGKLFNSKDSLLWFATYHEFLTYNLDDEKFDGFLKEFMSTLKDKKFEEYDDMSFEEYGKQKSTKDRKVIITKMDMLEKLMKEYLHIENVDEFELPEEVENEKDPSIDDGLEPIEFLHKYVSTEITEDDLDEYYDDINYFTKKRLLPKNHNLINEKNEISFLAIVAYAMRKEKDNEFEMWLKRYAITHRSVTAKTQRDNYIEMVNNFERALNMKRGVVA